MVPLPSRCILKPIESNRRHQYPFRTKPKSKRKRKLLRLRCIAMNSGHEWCERRRHHCHGSWPVVFAPSPRHTPKLLNRYFSLFQLFFPLSIRVHGPFSHSPNRAKFVFSIFGWSASARARAVAAGFVQQPLRAVELFCINSNIRKY